MDSFTDYFYKHAKFIYGVDLSHYANNLLASCAGEEKAASLHIVISVVDVFSLITTRPHHFVCPVHQLYWYSVVFHVFKIS